MPALATLTLVWLGAQQPDIAASAALERWAAGHGVKLEAPRANEHIESQEPFALSDRCETLLDQARDQVQGGDDDAAQGLLDELDQTLRQHPEILPAAWLMAERYRLQARIARRDAPDRARHFEELADVTEGARAPAFGETGRNARANVAKVRVDLVVHGARKHEVYWDGAPAADEVVTVPGEHHLLLFRGARLAWAGWINALTAGKVDVWVPDAPSCSSDDFEGVRIEGARPAMRVEVPAGVRCGSWAVATPAARAGALGIAVCKGEQCEPLTTWIDPSRTMPVAEERASKTLLPAWAAWTLAGVGVAAATSIVMWRAGVFDTARESKVIYDGSHL